MYYSEPGVFNAVDPWITIGSGLTGLVANDPSTTTAQNNTTVLVGIIALAVASCGQSKGYGATILIPGHSIVPPPGGSGTDNGAIYYFAKPNDATVAIPIDCNWPLRFLGTGSVQLVMAADRNGDFGDFFSVKTSGTGLGGNEGGITFEDLELVYPAFETQQTYAAIHVLPGNQSFRMIRVVLTNCPVGLNFEDGLQPTILDCTIQYSAGGNVGVGMILGGVNGAAKQASISGCLFYADHGIGGSTGIQIYAAEHIKMTDCRIDSFLNGIQIIPSAGTGNVLRCTFIGVAIYVGTNPTTGAVGTAVLIQPASDNQEIAQIVFTSCFFELGDTATPTSGGSGVIVDANGSVVDSVRFVSCYSARWPGPGLSIVGPASNIEVLGGAYIGNNYEEIEGQACGIYIGQDLEETGSPNGVRIVGVSCIGIYKWVTIGNSVNNPYQQAYGIYVDDGSKDVIIEGCDLRRNSEAGVLVNEGASNVIIDSCDVSQYATGSSTNGIVVNASAGAVTNVFIRNCNATGFSGYSTASYVDATGTNAATVEVTNCAGYNDVNASLTSTVTFGTPFYARSGGYYGSAVFFLGTIAAVTGVKIGTVSTGLKSGTFPLPPGVPGEIDGAGTATVVMLGQ